MGICAALCVAAFRRKDFKPTIHAKVCGVHLTKNKDILKHVEG